LISIERKGEKRKKGEGEGGKERKGKEGGEQVWSLRHFTH